MSDSSTRGVDPRFDPRFQRGYSDAAADAPMAPPSSHPPRVRRAAPTPPPADDAAARLLEAMQRTMPARQVRPSATEVEPDDPEDARETDLVEVEVLAQEPELEPEPGDRHARPWSIAGWVLSAALLVIGAWWIWAANSDPAYYTGSGITDMAFRQLGWNFAPVFMQSGAIGLVLVTSFAAARQLDRSRAVRRATGPDPAVADHGFWRTPGVVALIVIVAASGVVVIWLVGQFIDGSMFGYGPAPSDEEVTRMALAQVASAAIGPLAFAAFGAVFGIILLGARHERHVGNASDVSEPPAR